jgi:hypothetical protein
MSTTEEGAHEEEEDESMKKDEGETAPVSSDPNPAPDCAADVESVEEAVVDGEGGEVAEDSTATAADAAPESSKDAEETTGAPAVNADPSSRGEEEEEEKTAEDESGETSEQVSKNQEDAVEDAPEIIKNNTNSLETADHSAAAAAIPPKQQKEAELEEDCYLHHDLQPGDHVIRWEMTVIAWPIQIHGIVLETGKQYVEVADFGLTAAPDDKRNSSGNQKRPSAQHWHVHTTQPLLDHPVAQKMEEAVTSAWDKLKNEKKRPKQRITVHIITTQKELHRWHKVNYGGKLFGMGGGNEPHDGGYGRYGRRNQKRRMA